MKFILQDKEDWQVTVDQIIPHLKHSLLLLKGNLGAGKTTFTQFLLKKMGSADAVSSPTYALVNEYNVPSGKVFHLDLYRLKNIEEAYDLAIEEYLDAAVLTIIEWPEIYATELKDWPHHTIQIEVNENGREVSFE